MLLNLLIYLSAALAFAIMDAGWLSVMGSVLYKPTLNSILADNVRLAPAVAFYLLYPVGTVAFATLPALKAGSPGVALAYGALFGLLAYATYDLTNFATLKTWSLTITLADMAWGALATALSATAAYYAARAATDYFGLR